MSHFQQFHLFQINQNQNLMRKGLWITTIWSICDHMNMVVFKEGRVDVEELFHMTQLKA